MRMSMQAIPADKIPKSLRTGSLGTGKIAYRANPAVSV